jgi:hypothetical protein
MGIEIYGLRPTSPFGTSFNRTIWRWRPIWDYVVNTHPDLALKVEAPYYPDGDGLDEIDSTELAGRLKKEIEAGAVEEYARTLTEFANLVPDMQCTVCGGSGVRRDSAGRTLKMHEIELEPDAAVRLGRGRGWCDGCDGVGSTGRLLEVYAFDEDDLERFAMFLIDSGGFEIW